MPFSRKARIAGFGVCAGHKALPLSLRWKASQWISKIDRERIGVTRRLRATRQRDIATREIDTLRRIDMGCSETNGAIASRSFGAVPPTPSYDRMLDEILVRMEDHSVAGAGKACKTGLISRIANQRRFCANRGVCTGRAVRRWIVPLQ